MTSTEAGGRRTGAHLAEWAAVSFGMAVGAYFVIVVLTGFSMDYEIDRNPVLVWSGAAGAAGVIGWYGWVVRRRSLHGDSRSPQAGASRWSLATGTVLWVFGVWADATRLDRAAVDYGELVPRDPPWWPVWVSAAAVAAAASLLYARRRGMLRRALWSLPLQALWWLAVAAV